VATGGEEVGAPLGRSLLLNATFEPLRVLPVRRAVVLVLKEKAEVVARDGEVMRAERIQVPVPTVVRLTHYVRVPYRSTVPLTRRSVFLRDGHRCQYCNGPAENLDHVIPRSRGGAHAWDNVVAACRNCNSRKKDHLLGETPLRLARHPVAPSTDLWLASVAGPIEPDWRPYLSVPSARAV